MENHEKLIIDQFTKQAVPFANISGHSAEEATKLLIDMANISKEDTILDGACGPGILGCALAPYAKQVVGIDLVPAMVESAQKLQKEKELSNVSWEIGNVSSLSYDDSFFSVAVSRYSFHHFQNPEIILNEMVRIVKPKGKVAIIDVFTHSNDQSFAYDSLEKLRDPSHVHTLTLVELQEMAVGAGLFNLRVKFYKVEIPLEAQLNASFPKQESDKDIIRKTAVDDIRKDSLGWGVHMKGEKVYTSLPIAVIVGEKA